MSFIEKAHEIVKNQPLDVRAEFYKIACMELAEYVHPDMKLEILSELSKLFEEANYDKD